MSLAFADVDKPVSAVVVTSAMPGEGKSSVSVGLALSLAESMGRVLLIDADLRKPSVAEYTGLDGSVGLTSVLLGGSTIDDAVQPWGAPGLDVLVAGTIPPNPNQLLASDTMRATLAELKRRYDFVVIDTSPLIPVTDPLWLVHETDGAIVVARTMKTKRPHLAKAMDTLGSVGARVLGVVANDVKGHDRLTYYTESEKSSGRSRSTLTLGPKPSARRASASDRRAGDGSAVIDSGVDDSVVGDSAANGSVADDSAVDDGARR
jgi:capsular exopolysaccharide synthesis family protein